MKRKILIVDDNAVNRRILEKILRDEYTILQAEDGEKALAILRAKYESVSAVLLDIMMPALDGYQVLARMRQDAHMSPIPVIVTTGNTEVGSEVKALSLGANDFIVKPYNPAVIKHRLWNTINLRETAAFVNAATKDPLTGLFNREAFFKKAAEMIEAREAGYYVLSCMDIDNFKIINDQYGSEKGDAVLRHVAETFHQGFSELGGICCRLTADNFAVLYPSEYMHSEVLETIRRVAVVPDAAMPAMTISTGRYVVSDKSLSISAMYDRATIAETSVKGRFDTHVAQYDESMRERLLREQEIVNEMNGALETGQYEVWFQPQYNHASGLLIGAEALVRWRHPQRGLVPPGEFIPVFERNGFVYELDKYVWEQVCILLRQWIDAGESPLPISVNVSRYDVFRPDFFETVTAMVEAYRVPIDLIRLEITESAFAQSAAQMIDMVKRLMAYGFTIEIDDFGSGYSSLNTLKDVPARILKLDMRFLEGNENLQRGGNILESIVRMAKWLGMLVIAEGVETIRQADFLRSIGCFYVQGYLYARPMPVEAYRALAEQSAREREPIVLETVATLDNDTFWDPKSMETLIFNSYVGGACILEFYKDRLELLRVNEKYARELVGADMSMEAALSIDLLAYMDEKNRARLQESIDGAIESGEETTCEIRLDDLPGTPGATYLRTAVRVIARADERRLLYATVINVTAQRLAERKANETSSQMQAILKNVNGGVSAATLIDGQIGYLFINDEYFAMFGYTREQFARECPRGLVDLILPEDLPMVVDMADENAATGGATQIVYRVRRRDGSVIWVRSNSSACHVEGIDAPVHIAVTNDITSARESERRILESAEQLRFLNDTAHDLLEQPYADQGIERVLWKTLTYFQGKYACVSERDSERGMWKTTYAVYASDAANARGAIDASPIGAAPYWTQALKTNGYVYIADVEALGADRAEEKRLLCERGVRSLLAVPLTRDGALIGFVHVGEPSARRTQIEQLKAIGDYMAVILTRRDLTAKIRSDKENLERMMNDTPGGFVRMRALPDGVVVPVYVNDGFCKLVGMTHDEVMARYGEDAMWGVHPEDVPIVDAAVREMVETGETRNVKYRLRRDSGYVWLMIFGRMTKNDAGETFFNVYYTDLTPTEKQALSQDIRHARDGELVLRHVAAHSNRPVYRYDLETNTARADDANARIFGVDTIGDLPESLIRDGVILPESVGEVRALFRDIHAGEPQGSVKIHLRDPEGTPRWVDMRYTRIERADGESPCAILSLADITIDHEKELAYRRYRQMIDDNPKTGYMAYFETDLTANIVEKQGCNVPGIALPERGCRHEESVEHCVDGYVSEEYRAQAKAFFHRENLLRRFGEGTRSSAMDLPVHWPNGATRWFHARVEMIRDPLGGHVKAYTTLHDVTGKMLAALSVKKRAETDGMTELYNKTTAEGMIRKRLETQSQGTCALLIADLDNLKSINDTYGHAQGDRAIRQFAAQLHAQFRRTDIVGRVGGDEFVVFLEGMDDTARLNDMMASLMHKLANVRVGEHAEVQLHGSIGIAIGVFGTDTYETLFRRADRALYHVKRNGKNGYQLYSPQMDQSAYRYPKKAADDARADAAENAEMRYLLRAITALYPMVICANLTENSYYMIRYEAYATRKCLNAGRFDELIEQGAETFDPQDRASFYAAFRRENLLRAHARGEKSVCHEGSQLGDDGVYRRMRTQAVFVSSPESDDVLMITFARECEQT